ncbi:MAG: cytochrome P460 family protein [Candidatus Kapabacteria bacterium]|nr:cytochrome P460 family protein [Candidatus Kapabacteria bacterium]
MLRCSKLGILAAVCGVGTVLVLAVAQQNPANTIPYPQGYRSWTHIKTALLHPGHPLYNDFGGIHHIYANPKAAEALQKGATRFPDGSILVFDLLEAPTADNATTEGKRKVLAVMVKNSKRFRETGGWGYAAFAEGDPKRQIVTDMKTACHNCHAGQAHRDYVFSQWRP